MHCFGKGWTLVEIMVVLVMLISTVTLAAPLLQSVVQGNRVWAASSRFLLALSLARSEAVLRHRTVSVCPSAIDRTGLARCSGTYRDGWLVFANLNRDRVIDEGIDTVLGGFEGLPLGYSVSNRDGMGAVSAQINFNPDGTANANRTVRFCPPSISSATSVSVVLNIVGRARLHRDSAGCSQI